MTLRELVDETLHVFRRASNDGLPVLPEEAIVLLDLVVVLWLAAAPTLNGADRGDVGRTLYPDGPDAMEDPLTAARRLRATMSAASAATSRATAATAHAAARAIHLMYARKGASGALDRLISPFLPQLAVSLATHRERA